MNALPLDTLLRLHEDTAKDPILAEILRALCDEIARLEARMDAQEAPVECYEVGKAEAGFSEWAET